MEQGGRSDQPLFLSETGHAMTENGIVSVFGRLRERAGVTREEIGPTLVRDSFAVRYLQAGGDVFTLRDLLGHQESAAFLTSLGGLRLCKENVTAQGSRST